MQLDEKEQKELIELLAPILKLDASRFKETINKPLDPRLSELCCKFSKYTADGLRQFLKLHKLCDPVGQLTEKHLLNRFKWVYKKALNERIKAAEMARKKSAEEVGTISSSTTSSSSLAKTVTPEGNPSQTFHFPEQFSDENEPKESFEAIQLTAALVDVHSEPTPPATPPNSSPLLESYTFVTNPLKGARSSRTNSFEFQNPSRGSTPLPSVGKTERTGEKEVQAQGFTGTQPERKEKQEAQTQGQKRRVSIDLGRDSPAFIFDSPDDSRPGSRNHSSLAGSVLQIEVLQPGLALNLSLNLPPSAFTQNSFGSSFGAVVTQDPLIQGQAVSAVSIVRTSSEEVSRPGSAFEFVLPSGQGTPIAVGTLSSMSSNVAVEQVGRSSSEEHRRPGSAAAQFEFQPPSGRQTPVETENQLALKPSQSPESPLLSTQSITATDRKAIEESLRSHNGHNGETHRASFSFSFESSSSREESPTPSRPDSRNGDATFSSSSLSSRDLDLKGTKENQFIQREKKESEESREQPKSRTSSESGFVHVPLDPVSPMSTPEQLSIPNSRRDSGFTFEPPSPGSSARSSSQTFSALNLNPFSLVLPDPFRGVSAASGFGPALTGPDLKHVQEAQATSQTATASEQRRKSKEEAENLGVGLTQGSLQQPASSQAEAVPPREVSSSADIQAAAQEAVVRQRAVAEEAARNRFNALNLSSRPDMRASLQIIQAELNNIDTLNIVSEELACFRSLLIQVQTAIQSSIEASNREFNQENFRAINDLQARRNRVTTRQQNLNPNAVNLSEEQRQYRRHYAVLLATELTSVDGLIAVERERLAAAERERLAAVERERLAAAERAAAQTRVVPGPESLATRLQALQAQPPVNVQPPPVLQARQSGDSAASSPLTHAYSSDWDKMRALEAKPKLTNEELHALCKLKGC